MDTGQDAFVVVRVEEGSTSLDEVQREVRDAVMADNTVPLATRQKVARELGESIQQVGRRKKRLNKYSFELIDQVVQVYKTESPEAARRKADELAGHTVNFNTVKSWARKAITSNADGKESWVYRRLKRGRPVEMLEAVENAAKTRLDSFLARGVQITSLVSQYAYR